MTRRLHPVALAIVCLLLAGAAVAAPTRPRLVVLISIDQFRADYLRRFQDLFLPPQGSQGVGGFRYLMERGTYETDAHHDHYPLFTGPVPLPGQGRSGRAPERHDRADRGPRGVADGGGDGRGGPPHRGWVS